MKEFGLLSEISSFWEREKKKLFRTCLVTTVVINVIPTITQIFTNKKLLENNCFLMKNLTKPISTRMVIYFLLGKTIFGSQFSYVNNCVISGNAVYNNCRQVAKIDFILIFSMKLLIFNESKAV